MSILLSETTLLSYINSLGEGTEKRQPDYSFRAQLLGGITGVLSGGELRRRRLLRNLLHTIGANAFFVDLVRAARNVSCTGGDDQLEEWRSAEASACGRFRPDGYGCYRRGANRFGFFLEFDRGTERRSEYAAKLATYYRYRRTAATRDYRGFPTLLVVTTSQRAEDVIADQARIGADLYGI
jgi:Replication-relaxation